MSYGGDGYFVILGRSEAEIRGSSLKFTFFWLDPRLRGDDGEGVGMMKAWIEELKERRYLIVAHSTPVQIFPLASISSKAITLRYLSWSAYLG